ncbi:hypothetical protein M427DRAFT_199228 [Gonapodya prolifera JEL478]|uniref:Uncharacterized protein n=1 Tax=Gonapodya prolifera (strain JEL478) TaxID=1344416 RepID=A0A139AQ41_GONPJ|nr:hypothetical protein M427DRAFT_199228 [Gonapodya prolifera JEL478]|eukprot:KXS18774.1 hypothetical protein M427DRAFT_199228 [Gonapodya prolifera JEL478]
MAANARVDQIAQQLGVAPLQSRLLFKMALTTSPGKPTVVGKTPSGSRFIAGVEGGTVDGIVKGTVIGPAGDWVQQRSDGVNVIDVRLTIITSDTNEAIYMYYGGYLLPGKAHAELKTKGVMVDAEQVRMSARFETSSTKYGWLNSVVAVGRGKAFAGGANYDVFQLQ